MPRIIPATLALLLLATPVLADAEADSRFIAEQTVTRETLSTTFEAFAPVLSQVISYQLDQNEIVLTDPERFIAMISAEFEASFLGELRAQTTALQLEVFSADELAGIAAFYGTDAGQALVRNTPTLMARAQVVGEQIGVAALQDAGFRLASRIEAEDLIFTENAVMSEKLLDLLKR